MAAGTTRRDLLIATMGGVAGGVIALTTPWLIKSARESVNIYIEPYFEVDIFGENWEKVCRGQQYRPDEKEKELISSNGGFLVIGSHRGNGMVSLDVHDYLESETLAQDVRGGLPRIILQRPEGKKRYDFILRTPEGTQRIIKEPIFLSNSQLRITTAEKSLKKGETLAEHLSAVKNEFCKLDMGGVNYNIYGLDALSY